MVDMISSVDNVYRCMHLDPADLGTGQILFVVDMMDVIVLYDRENSSEMSYYAGLSAVVDMASSYDVRSDRLLCPSFVLSLQYIVSLGLCSVFGILCTFRV